MNIASVLDATVQQHPERTALVYLGSRIRYGELGRCIRQAAAGLGDGLADEVITLLTHVPRLRVTARTSSFAYRSVP